jgi:cob(I)alamin adenosyltransferase
MGMILDQIRNQVQPIDSNPTNIASGAKNKNQTGGQNLYDELSKTLLKIQSKLFTLGAMLASPPEKGSKKDKKSRLKIDLISGDDIMYLENLMDRMNEDLPDMTHFILPGGHPAVSFCHIARCVCRRAERKTVELHDLEGVDPQILTYLNRLSDYLFVLARKLSKDLGVDEIPWKG